MINLSKLAAIFFCGTMLSSCNAEVNATAAGSKRECVGRMMLSLPGEVEVAGLRLLDLRDEIEVSSQRVYEFVDGHQVDHVSISYGGNIYISQSLSTKNINSLFPIVTREIKKQRDSFRKRDSSTLLSSVFHMVKSEDDFMAWKVDAYHAVIRKIGDRVFYWQANDSGSDTAEIRYAFKNVLTALAGRKSYEIPVGPGVCFPYSFVQDNGEVQRKVGTGFSLKAHPDVVIWLEDSSASFEDRTDLLGRGAVKHKLNDFWNQFRQPNEEIKSLWSFPSVRPVGLGEQGGSSTFVSIRRTDGTMDFGYMAMALGNKGAATDTPYLSFYMVQHSARAKAAGIAPLDEKSFLAMAQRVASSVRHRPTKATQ